MADKKYQWHKVADSVEAISFSASGLAEVKVGDKVICIARYNGNFRACAHKCPHAGGFLVNGYMDAMGNIVCPLHQYKFSLKNGQNITGEGYYLKTFPLEVRKEGLFVGIDNDDWQQR